MKKRKESVARCHEDASRRATSRIPSDQLVIALKRISHLLSINDQNQEDTALLIQPMVYGNYGKDSLNGQFYTRNIVTGDKEIQGEYFQNKFNAIGTSGSDIANIAKSYHGELEKIAHAVEDHFREIRSIRFTVENKRLWLIDQRSVMTKSTQADIRLLLDLHARKIVNDTVRREADQAGAAQRDPPPHHRFHLGEGHDLPHRRNHRRARRGHRADLLLHDGLLEAHKLAQQKGHDTKLILCLVSSFAEDVKAIEVATGVLSTEGGYSAHASVVARQYGKVSLVKPDMKIKGNRATIGDRSIKEGDYVTLNVPFYGAPSLYLGKAELIEPDPEESGMLDFLALVEKFVSGFHVRANADKPRDAALARKFGAKGIGLVRTEHMFFDEKRINVFREMVLSDSVEERKEGPCEASAHAEGGLLQAPEDHGGLPRHHPASGRAAARVPAPQRPGAGAVHEVPERREDRVARGFRRRTCAPAQRRCTSSTPCSGTAAAASPSPIPRSTRCRSARSSRPSTRCARRACTSSPR